MVFSAVEGTTYYIAIDGYTDGATPAAEGVFQLDIQPYFMHQGADFDGDGMTDLTVFRPSDTTWYIFRSGNNQMQITRFGQTGDIPVTANKAF